MLSEFILDSVRGEKYIRFDYDVFFSVCEQLFHQKSYESRTISRYVRIQFYRLGPTEMHESPTRGLSYLIVF